jgi:UDP-glucose 4-epimerase
VKTLQRILVLGSEGFIGRSVVSKGVELGYEVTGIDITDHSPVGYNYRKISLLNPDFDYFLSTHFFDCIFNCSGSGNVSFSVEQPLSDFELNCEAVLFALDAIRKYQPGCKFIQLSSAAVYGNPESLPVSEISGINPVSPYGYHKWMAEIGCREYASLYSLPIAIVRPFSVYGPGLRKQLIWDVYQKAKNKDEVELWGTGDETRDFIFVEDLAAALFVIAGQLQQKIEIFNIGSGCSVTISELVKQLFAELGWQKKIRFNAMVRQGDPRFWQAEISKLQHAGFKPVYSLKDGLKKTAGWLIKYGD